MHGRKPAADTAARLRAARIPQAPDLKVLDVRLVDRTAKSFDDKIQKIRQKIRLYETSRGSYNI